MSRFEGQIAIVTGGAAGIGKAVTERIASEGAKVYVFDWDKETMESAQKEFESKGLQTDCLAVDISDEESVKQSIAKVAAQEGKLDVLINCAAIVGPNGTKISDVATEDFDKVCQVNLRGSFLVTKYAISAMEKANYGRILLFASISGKEGNAGMCPYSATKAAVICLVKSVGKEYAETGITINAVAPAVIDTPMVQSMDKGQVKYMTDKIPMKRLGQLDEIASLTSWVVSKESSFNTGFTFDLTGGRAVY